MVRELGERGINTTSTVREFGIYDMDEKGVASAIRISPHYFSTSEEIERVAEGLAEMATRGSSKD